MNFDQVLSAAWDKHGHNLVLALSELRELSRSVAVEEQIPPLARLCVHVYAEHLGRWEEGREFLSGLTQLSGFSWSGSSGAAVRRSTAILDFCGGDETVLARLGRSDQIAVLATASSVLREHGRGAEANRHYISALELAEDVLDEKDPSNRTLAITSNNLACALEEKESLTAFENDLMIRAATAARKYWEIAGTWVEIQVAEYRLAKTYLKANKPTEALTHAHECDKICTANRAGDVDMFFAYEALARAYKAAGEAKKYSEMVDRSRALLQKMSDRDKSNFATSLAGL